MSTKNLNPSSSNTTPNQDNYAAHEVDRNARVEAKLRESQHGVTHWHSVPKQHPDYAHAAFVEEAHHLAAGIALILSIKEQADLDRAFIKDSDNPENEAAPLLSVNNEAVLLRLAQVAASRFADDCERSLSWLSERAQGVGNDE